MPHTPSRRVIRRLWLSAFLLVLLRVFMSATSHAQPASALEGEVDAARQLEIIDSVSATLNHEYVFPDVAPKFETHLRERYRSGAYKDIRSGKAFAGALSRDLQAVSRDLHLRVDYYPDSYFDMALNQQPDQQELERRLREAQRDNFGFRRVDILPGNVGYLKFDEFYDAKNAASTAIAALNFLGHCDALIIDLLDNGGGDPNMVTLIAGYFFDKATLFNTLFTPKDKTTVQLWTQAHIDGPQLSQCDIYVLISYDTFSAGEDLAYGLKHSGRATLVGTQTPGGAHDEEFHNCRNLNIRIKVPCRRAISPFTGTNWEGVGVAPDIEAPAYKAYDVAYLEAVRRIRARTTNTERLAELDWILPSLEANVSPVFVKEDILRSYTGVYGPVEVTYDHGTLLATQTNRRPMGLVAMSQTMFNCQWMNEFRLEFHPDASGSTDSLTAYMDNGPAFQLRRSK